MSPPAPRHLPLAAVLAALLLALAASCTPASTGGAGSGPQDAGPVIDAQPQPQTVTEGQAATFAVTAHGAGTLGYAWRKNGTAIGGASAAAYTTPATALADSGARYSVVVTDGARSVESAAAALTVNPASHGLAPSITSPLAGQTVNAGQTATFAVVATGTAPLSYAWQRNGAAIAGAPDAASYTTPPTAAGDGGATFTVVVSNAAGQVSSTATLTVRVPPAITTQPASVTVTAGQAATFSVIASGTAPLGYTWRKNGAAISGAANAATYTTPATVTGDSGATYSVVVANAAGSATSSAATLTVTAGSTATFAIDVTQPPTSRAAGPLPVSPYVYGINPYDGDIDRKTRWGLFRSGGDNFPAYNWVANYSNHGANYCFWAGLESADFPADAFAWLAPAAAKGIAGLVTSPVGPYLAARRDNQTWPACDSVPPSTNVNGIPYAPSAYFVANAAAKGGAFCLQPGPAGETVSGSCTLDKAATTVYQDEFASYLKHWYVDGKGATAFIELDNEPNYWAGTHPELWTLAAHPDQRVTYDDIVTKDKAVATAVKAAWPAARIFGPVVAQDGIVYAHDYQHAGEFLDYYLPLMNGLLDVLDVHYYNSSSVPATCLQNPRAFWDPAYTVPGNQDGMDYVAGNIPSWAHRQMIPRLLDKIAAANMSPRPGLAFTEYDSGCEGDISGGIAEAEALGLFGKYGVHAATAWLNARPTAGGAVDRTRDYAGVAFDAYRNYDGNGATVGDTAVRAVASNDVTTSVYAFTHSDAAGQVDLVALNKTGGAVPVHVTIATSATLHTAARYHLVAAASGANVAVTAVGGTAPAVGCSGGSCALDLTLEPMSVTTIVLR